jgi:uncharacterized membrane protein YfcA
MTDAASLIFVTVAAPFASKTLFWVNATIFLFTMERRLTKEFWRVSAVELVLGAIIGCSFGIAVAYQEVRTFFAVVFGVSAIAYLWYMVRRAWMLSAPQGS